MLATSTSEDLAVATSTLILWRSLGTVMGVAVSSLIVQNALIYFLDQLVAGPRKEEVCNSAPTVERAGLMLILSPLASDSPSAQVN